MKLWDTNTSTAYSAALWYFDGYSAQSAVYDCVNRGGTVVNP